MDTNYWETSEREASSIHGQTKAECESEYELLISLFDLYYRGFDALPRKVDADRAPMVRAAILSQTLNTFRAIIELAVTGFYIQSLIPLRHVYESWLSFWYLAKYPQDATRWLDPTWRMRPPKAETMTKRIDHPSKRVKCKLGEFQNEMHRFVHIDPAAVLSRLDREGEKTIIGLGIRFEKHSFRACTYGTSLWLGNCLDALSSMVPPDHDWHQEQRSSIDAILTFIDEYNAATGGIRLPDTSLEHDAG